jgi:hypothetical protein
MARILWLNLSGDGNLPPSLLIADSCETLVDVLLADSCETWMYGEN